MRRGIQLRSPRLGHAAPADKAPPRRGCGAATQLGSARLEAIGGGSVAPAAHRRSPRRPAALSSLLSPAWPLSPAQPPVPSGGRPETVAASPSASPSGSIDIRALANSWIQIRDGDQAIVFARVLKAGETYRVPRPGLMMRTGNAGALEVLVDGKPAPSLGALGTLRRNVTLEPDALLAGTAVRG